MNVKIGAIDYTLVSVFNLMNDDKTQKLNGEISYDHSEIRIDSNLDVQARRATFWHEVVHGILTHAGHDMDDDIVDALGRGIMAFLKDNDIDHDLLV